jgi:GTPase
MDSFIDEAVFTVLAGQGGHGCVSFRREKYIPFGGPDGGDGGRGGHIYLQATSQDNTLSKFRHRRRFKSDSGQCGSGRQKTGAQGEDLILEVPLGTRVYASETDELLEDLTEDGQRCLVAKGGDSGVGNLRFKSSTNRSPRQFTKGNPGEERMLRLELAVLADVGLLGFPNVGKSTFLRAVSAATPRVAAYPFTTLRPYLGVVEVDSARHFVMADIPGLIAGASQGMGLGLKFLKHIARCRVLLHIVDFSEEIELIVKHIGEIEKELENFQPELMLKPRWLVMNKIDMIPKEEWSEKLLALKKALAWDGPFQEISALSKHGCSQLMLTLAKSLQEYDCIVEEENEAL